MTKITKCNKENANPETLKSLLYYAKIGKMGFEKNILLVLGIIMDIETLNNCILY